MISVINISEVLTVLFSVVGIGILSFFLYERIKKRNKNIYISVFLFLIPVALIFSINDFMMEKNYNKESDLKVISTLSNALNGKKVKSSYSLPKKSLLHIRDHMSKEKKEYFSNEIIKIAMDDKITFAERNYIFAIINEDIESNKKKIWVDKLKNKPVLTEVEVMDIESEDSISEYAAVFLLVMSVILFILWVLLSGSYI